MPFSVSVSERRKAQILKKQKSDKKYVSQCDRLVFLICDIGGMVILTQKYQR